MAVKTLNQYFCPLKPEALINHSVLLLKNWKKSLRLIDVNSVKISPVGQDDYSFSMEAVSYWRKTGDKT